MSSRALSTHKYVSAKVTGNNIPNLKGWKYVGYYGSDLIYALDNIRRLIDPVTGQVTFQFRLPDGRRR